MRVEVNFPNGSHGPKHAGSTSVTYYWPNCVLRYFGALVDLRYGRGNRQEVERLGSYLKSKPHLRDAAEAAEQLAPDCTRIQFEGCLADNEGGTDVYSCS